MAKMNLSFEFEENAPASEAELYLAAPRLLSALCDLMQTMRSKVKYGEYDEPQGRKLDELYAEMWEIVNSHGVGEFL